MTRASDAGSPTGVALDFIAGGAPVDVTTADLIKDGAIDAIAPPGATPP